MNWTTEKPTKEGFYWFNGSVRGGPVEPPSIYEILDGCNGLEVVNADTSDPLSDYIGEWFGPLEPPTDDPPPNPFATIKPQIIKP